MNTRQLKLIADRQSDKRIDRQHERRQHEPQQDRQHERRQHEPQQDRQHERLKDRQHERLQDHPHDRQQELQHERHPEHRKDRQLERERDHQREREPDLQYEHQKDRQQERPHERQQERPHERQQERPHERQQERSHERQQERLPERQQERPHERQQERPHERQQERSHERQQERSHERQQERLPERQQERLPERQQERLPERQQERLPERQQERLPERQQERLPERQQERLPERQQERLPERQQERLPERQQERLPERQQERLPERQQERLEEAATAPQVLKASGAPVVVITGGHRVLRRSASSLAASLACGGVASVAGGRGGARNSAKIVKVSASYLDSKRRSRARQTFPLPGRAPLTVTSQADGGRVAAGSVSAAVSAAELAAATDPGGRAHKYSRSVTSLASVARGAEPEGHHKSHQRRRHSRHSEKSHKYVAGGTLPRQRHPAAHGRPLWRPVLPAPPPDPVKPNMSGKTPCCCCCPAIRAASPASLILLPLHLLLLAVLVGYLVLGAFIFSKVEGPDGLRGSAVLVSRTTVTLPGTPKDPDMAAARLEVVERLLNSSLNIVLYRSPELFIAAISTSPRLRGALFTLQKEGGWRLPTDRELNMLSRSVMTEWQQQLHDITARYYTLVTRHAHGFQVGSEERAEVWESEEPPPLLPWSLWPSLLHVFCLVTTIGTSVQAHSPAGRASALVYTLVGVVLYVGVVVVWAARLGATYALLVNMCTKNKISSSGGKLRASPYHSMGGPPQEPAPPPQTTPVRLVLLTTVIMVYVLSAGVHVVGGRDYWTGVENAIFVLLTVRPPTPLPQGATTVTSFIAFVMVGHILLALFTFVLKVLCGRWWSLWDRTS
ncbi:uncharacterized protein [Procambarus clarkii]|uniref:uncharacterized protein isoform X2 n=1 Tax=Procambarus clarkii TaxID=6728 RepID=UPI001E672798|nr:uncharacterized protein LOC123774383 [Procambarus clarkii]